jgi:signal transduction histidine kinase
VSHPSITQLAEEKKSHEARRAFLRYVFHEVRVPLNSISMGVQVRGDWIEHVICFLCVLNDQFFFQQWFSV